MPDQEPERVKINGDRHYDVAGDNFVSVTTSLKAYEPKAKALEGWKKRTENWEEVRDTKGVIGTAAHHRILDQYAIRKLPAPPIDLSLVDDEVITDIETCEVLWEECDFDMGDSPMIEKKVWSNEYEYAGTADALVKDDIVVDLKTSAAVQDSYRMQVAAYKHAFNEMPSMPNPTRAAIIVLCPQEDRNPNMTAKVEHITEAQLDKWFDTYTDVLEKYYEEYQ